MDYRVQIYLIAVVLWLVFVIVRWDSFTPDEGVSHSVPNSIEQTQTS